MQIIDTTDIPTTDELLRLMLLGALRTPMTVGVARVVRNAAGKYAKTMNATKLLEYETVAYVAVASHLSRDERVEMVREFQQQVESAQAAR